MCVFNVKANTSNVMVYGECGVLPPSVYCTVSTMCYMNRLHHMPDNSIVRQVYNELFKLHQMGFVNWVTRVGELVDTYSINIDDSPAKFKSECKRSVFGKFSHEWSEVVQNIQWNPILWTYRTYCIIKQEFGLKTYFELIKNHKYRTAMAQLRTSSHTLAIGYGRYTRPKTKLEDRCCLFCTHALDDEKHFLVEYIVNKTERDILFSKVERLFQNFSSLDGDENLFSFWTVTISRYLPGLVNLYVIHLKQEMKSWYDYVRGCKSPVQCRQIFITYQYICMGVCMCADTYVSICMYACVYLYVHIYV